MLGGFGADQIFGNSGNDILGGGDGDSSSSRLIPLWLSDKSYGERVDDIVNYFESSVDGRHTDGDADEIVDPKGRNYYLVRTGLDVFTVDDNEDIFELLDV